MFIQQKNPTKRIFQSQNHFLSDFLLSKHWMECAHKNICQPTENKKRKDPKCLTKKYRWWKRNKLKLCDISYLNFVRSFTDNECIWQPCLSFTAKTLSAKQNRGQQQQLVSIFSSYLLVHFCRIKTYELYKSAFQLKHF